MPEPHPTKAPSAQEEREALEELRGELRRQSRLFFKNTRRLPRPHRNLLKELKRHLAAGDDASTLWRLEQILRQEEGERHSLGMNMRELLRDISALSPRHPLPTPLGKALRDDFFRRVREHPRLLSELLLSIVDEEEAPEENLFKVTKLLGRNLAYWQEGITPGVLNPEDELERRRRECRRLHGFVSMWSSNVRQLRTSESTRSIPGNHHWLGLLRWRISKCENVFQLPEVWTSCSMGFHSFDSYREFIEALSSLRLSLFAEGESSLSVLTWDTLATCVMDLARRADGQNDEGVEDEEARAALQALAQDATTAVEMLRELEAELPSLPREMREALVGRALLH